MLSCNLFFCFVNTDEQRMSVIVFQLKQIEHVINLHVDHYCPIFQEYNDNHVILQTFADLLLTPLFQQLNIIVDRLVTKISTQTMQSNQSQSNPMISKPLINDNMRPSAEQEFHRYLSTKTIQSMREMKQILPIIQSIFFKLSLSVSSLDINLSIKIKQLEARLFDKYIIHQITQLSWREDYIRNSVTLSQWNMNRKNLIIEKTGSNDSDMLGHYYFDLCVIDIVTMINPNIENIRKLPCQSHHILLLSKLFSSIFQTFVETIFERIKIEIQTIKSINKNETTVKTSKFDQLFVMLGTLYHTRKLCKEYLQIHDLEQAYLDAQSQYSADDTTVKNDQKLSQDLQNILQCKPLFDFIETTIIQAAQLCGDGFKLTKLIQTCIHSIVITLQPIDSDYSQQEVELLFGNKYYPQIVEKLKFWNDSFLDDFLHKLLRYSLHSGLCNILAVLSPSNVDTVLCPEQLCRVKYLHKILLKAWKRDWEFDISNQTEIENLNKEIKYLLSLSFADVATMIDEIDKQENQRHSDTIETLIQQRKLLFSNSLENVGQLT